MINLLTYYHIEGFEISTENKSSYDTLDDMVEEGS